MKQFIFVTMAVLSVVSVVQADFSNGFETDIAGWFTPTRVASGTGGITSASGSFHATTATNAGDFTRWGGYNYGAGNAVPTAFQKYSTSVDIYLNVNGGWANDTRFDFSSAINNSAGTHLRDFAFTAGFYNDATNPGPANANRFIISASNNAGRGNAYPANPGRNPIAIATSGWYTFEHKFYDNAGVLAVDMNIYDSSNTSVGSWTLSDPTDLITGVGGNRYGWFVSNEFSTLAIDNSQLTVGGAVVPAPGAALLALIGLPIVGWVKRRFA